ncbi:MAG TPA: class I SAM-dependent methyltransferase [Terriglobia bacterium]|nr:class I SAM-dependent methyltransferase [Terriglobia bacterium]
MRDYSIITELPGGRASREQISRLYHRYRTAASYAAGKDVLEVGCGAGQGLGYMAAKARRVVGGDSTESSLRQARQHSNGATPLVRLDAHRLPFPRASFDLVILFEAIYYLASPEAFLAEARRVLRPAGTLLVSTVNCSWLDFNPSPFSVRYFAAPDLAASLRRQGFEVELFGAYRAAPETVRDKAVSVLKRSAVRLGLMPRSMKGKELFKRIFFGRLEALPAEVHDGMAEYLPPEMISAETPDCGHKILYAVAQKAG